MKNFIKKGLLAAAAFALAIALVPARPAEARSKIYVARTVKNYRKVNGKWRKVSVSKRKFNKKGLMTSYKVTSYDEKGKKTYTYSGKYTYKKGKQTGAKYYSDGKLVDRVVYKYKGKNLKSETWYNGNSKSYSYKYTYTYDKKGRTKTEKYYGEDHKLHSSTKYTYNGKKKTTITYKDAKGSTTSTTKITRTYKKGKLKTQVSKYSEGGKYTSTYNSKGYVTKSVNTHSDGSKDTTKYTYKYYKKKYIKQRIEKDSSGYQYKSVYSNWKKY